MDKRTVLRFSRENMWTVAGFVLDSFEADQATFVDLLGADDFGPAFLTAFAAARAQVKAATGAAVRRGSGVVVTNRLYANLDALPPLLDRLDARLGLLPAEALTVPVKNFGLRALRSRLRARDAEAVSQGLGQLRHLIADNRSALDSKGYKKAEFDELTALHTAIDADNALQNVGQNTSQETTRAEDAAYATLNKLLGQVLRAGRLLFKNDKAKRRQYEQAALNKRVTAGDVPPVRPV